MRSQIKGPDGIQFDFTNESYFSLNNEAMTNKYILFINKETVESVCLTKKTIIIWDFYKLLSLYSTKRKTCSINPQYPLPNISVQLYERDKIALRSSLSEGFYISVLGYLFLKFVCTLRSDCLCNNIQSNTANMISKGNIKVSVLTITSPY